MNSTNSTNKYKVLGIVMNHKEKVGIVPCPKCGEKRVLRYDTASKAKNGKYSGLCATCSKKGKSYHTPERIEKLRQSSFGANNPNWRGGKARLKDHIRTLAQYRQWRCDVFERDGFACVFCGDKTGHNLEADHIKAFSDILFENDIDSTEKAVDCLELWNINNGRTLCKPCHRKTENYGAKKK